MPCQHCTWSASATYVEDSAVLQFDDLDQQCKDANIQAFPAWIIQGQTYSGAQSFDKLEKILDGQ